MTPLDTLISHVTVYPTKALILRKGIANIRPKKSTLEITGLPIYLDPNSLRVKGLSLTKTTIEGIDIKRVSHKKAVEPDQKVLDKLQNLNNKKERLVKELEFLEKREETNHQLESRFAQDFSRYYSRGNITLEQFSALRNQLQEDYTDQINQKQTLITEFREIERDIEIIQKKINEKRITQKLDDFSVLVFLNNPSSEKQDEFQLEISYVISHASWFPLYDFRANLADGNLLVDYFGMITQSTGEDWKDVELTLSTASPSIVTTIPEITPWYLDVYLPPSPPAPRAEARRNLRAFKKMAKPMASAGVMADAFEADEAMEPEPEIAAQVSALIEDTGEKQLYNIPKKESIPSGKKPHQVLIAQVSNSLQDDFIAIPYVTSDIIHRGKMTNDSKLIFLPGEVRLFEGNEFIGKTRIKQIAPTEKITLALGTTGKIKVKRKISSQEVSKKGMIAKTRQKRMEVTIDVTNNRVKETTLIVKDRVPTSRHEDIKVKILDLTPTPNKQTKLNIITWKLLLKPQEKQKLKENYEIENPIETIVTGI